MQVVKAIQMLFTMLVRLIQNYVNYNAANRIKFLLKAPGK